MERNPTEYLSSFFLFHGLTQEETAALCAERCGEIRTYEKGETVTSPDRNTAEVGFLLSGECRVERPRSEEDLLPMPMNLLKAGDSFGVLSVLTEHAAVPTVIVAVKKCEILYYSKDDVLAFMRESSEVSLNVARFLAGRVCFLNDKIAAFAGRSADEKLTAYLTSQQQKFGNVFPFSPLAVAKNLNVGRASLYRSLASLEESGSIRREGKMITLCGKFLPQKGK